MKYKNEFYQLGYLFESGSHLYYKKKFIFMQ